MSRTFVFTGPSLHADEARRLMPDASILPPVRHGDLLSCGAGTGDRVVILDGVFFQSASVRHKEICALIDAGVTVHGAASMGALRAAELEPFGMAGSGVVHRLYRCGLLERDDEVALVHGGPEQGWRALTVALVSVRIALRRLRRRGRIDAEAERQLLAAALAVPFTDRTWPAVLDTAGPLPRRVLDAVRDHTGGPAATWDVKAQDALTLVTRLAATAGTVPTRRTVAATVHLERWRRAADPADRLLVTAAQVHAADYPDFHRRVILRLLSGLDSDDLDVLQDAALHAARLRGLDADLAAAPLEHWLTPRERSGGDPAAARALVRSYRWSGGLTPLPVLAAEIRRRPGAADALTALISDAERLNADLAERGQLLDRVSDAAVHRHCLARWDAAAPIPEIYDRGFTGLADLAERARPFVPHLALREPEPLFLTAEGAPR